SCWPRGPETAQALKEALAKRPDPKKEEHGELVFVTKYGDTWGKHTREHRINKKGVIERGQCPACRTPEVRRKHRLRRKTVYIKFFTGGVKKWLVQCVSWAYECGACGGQFLSDRWPGERSLYQPSLACWCVYQNIECKQNMWQVQATLVD